MAGVVRATNRALARRLSPTARKRLAALVGGRAVAWYRRRRTDVYLVSFPKSGRTWLRVMIGRALQRQFDLPDDADLVELHHLAELDARVPSFDVTHDDNPQWKVAADVDREKDRYRGQRVILLVRDPRDVVVSLYHQMRDRRGQYTGSVGEFVDEPVGGFASVLAFYDAWAAAIHVPDAVLVVRYEDLHSRPAKELRRVLEFAGVASVADEAVEDAVAFASFANMRRMEESDALGSARLRAARPGDISTYKTRKGQVGSFRDELSADHIDRLNRLMAASNVDRFGYGADHE